MPELPEVETVVRFVRPRVRGRSLAKIVVDPDYPQVLDTHSVRSFNKLIRNQSVKQVRRRAKFILFDLDEGHIAVHLRMTGRLQTRFQKDENRSHLRATFVFDDSTRLYFKDYRKFGRIYYYPDLTLLEAKLGIEPLSRAFTGQWLQECLKVKSRMIKPLLLDQSVIAGLGNIYVDEALWAAKIHPCALSHNVPRGKVLELHSAIQRILKRSIAQNGTTFINFYFGNKESGEFANELEVFDRAGEACHRCRARIRKTKVAQRGTHFCPRCQRAPK